MFAVLGVVLVTCEERLDVMDDYELEERPFYENSYTAVRLYRGTSKSRNLPIVAKRHKFRTFEGPEMWEKLNAAMNAGLAQARVEHPHSCKIIAMHLDWSEAKKDTYHLYHILEALPGDMRKEIAKRKKENRVYSEVELWDFLVQASSALTFAHNKVSPT